MPRSLVLSAVLQCEQGDAAQCPTYCYLDPDTRHCLSCYDLCTSPYGEAACRQLCLAPGENNFYNSSAFQRALMSNDLFIDNNFSDEDPQMVADTTVSSSSGSPADLIAASMSLIPSANSADSYVDATLVEFLGVAVIVLALIIVAIAFIINWCRIKKSASVLGMDEDELYSMVSIGTSSDPSLHAAEHTASVYDVSAEAVSNNHHDSECRTPASSIPGVPQSSMQGTVSTPSIGSVNSSIQHHPLRATARPEFEPLLSTQRESDVEPRDGAADTSSRMAHPSDQVPDSEMSGV